MNKVAKKLTLFLKENNLVTEENEEIYEYGFELGLEAIFSVFICLLLAYILGMLLESFIFFLIFIPIRSFSGGLHLKRYLSCLLLTCVSMMFVLFVADFFLIKNNLTFLMCLVNILFVRLLYPVENANRAVSNEENKIFRKRLQYILFLDVLLIALFYIFKLFLFIRICCFTLLVLVCTMLLGKILYILQGNS